MTASKVAEAERVATKSPAVLDLAGERPPRATGPGDRTIDVPGDDAGDGLPEAKVALDAALDKKALEPVLLDVRGLCTYTNFILMVSGRSDRQVDAIASGVLTALRGHGARPLGVEGKGSGQWVLIDHGDLVTHVFHHPIRQRYDLESLWIDAVRVPIDVPAEARIPAEDAY